MIPDNKNGICLNSASFELKKALNNLNRIPGANEIFAGSLGDKKNNPVPILKQTRGRQSKMQINQMISSRLWLAPIRVAVVACISLIFLSWISGHCYAQEGTDEIATNLKALEDNDVTTRRNAITELFKIGEPAVVPLIGALKHENIYVRSSAAKALAKIRDERAIKPLIEALQDSERGIAADAAEALANIHAPQAVEPLIATMKNENVDIRAWAAKALGRFGDPKAVEPLISALKTDESSHVKEWAAESLGRLKDSRAKEPLLAASKDKDAAVAKAASKALAQGFGITSGEPTAKPESNTAK